MFRPHRDNYVWKDPLGITHEIEKGVILLSGSLSLDNPSLIQSNFWQHYTESKTKEDKKVFEWAIPGLFFFIIVFSNTVYRK